MIDPTAHLIAEVVPTHESGDAQAGDVQLESGRWATRLDASAWHEAGHVVVYLHLGWRVHAAHIRRELLNGSVGQTRADAPPEHDAVSRFRVSAVGAMAGPIAANAVRSGLGIPGHNTAEVLSPTDLEIIGRAKAAIPNASRDFEGECERIASAILLERRQAFGAIVAALLGHHALDEAQILDAWHRHPIAVMPAEPPRTMSRQARRHAERQAAKRNRRN